MKRPRGLGTTWLALLFAGLACAALYLAVGDVNLNLADEGYLWYGVIGVLEGEVPFRDFQAYDPGRYRWCALGSWFFGSGILGVRASLAVFQALGLAAGLLVARRFLKHDLWMLPLAALLALWMFPRHKLFEPALALIVLWSCVRLLESPSLLRHLSAGVCVGLVAWFGRNHGLYAGLGMGAAYGYLLWKRPTHSTRARLARLGCLALGVLLGYLPMLFNLLFVDGFAGAYGRELSELSKKGANLPLPWNWPWTAEWSAAASLPELLGLWATNLAFSLPLLILPLGLWRLLSIPRQPAPAPESAGLEPAKAALVGSTILGLIYLHHAAVRSDAQHLAQCIQPLLLLALALPRRRRGQLSGLALLSLLTFFFSFQNHSTLRFFAPWKPRYVTTPVEVAGESLRLNSGQASYLKALKVNLGTRLGPGEQVFIAPARATLYPVLGQRSPVREIYMLWQAEESEQRAMIQRLEEQTVGWALIVDTSIDEREDLRFHNSHALVWNYILERFEELPSGLGRGQRLFRRRP